MEPIRLYRGHVASLSRGFTLIELMVVVAIITILSAIVFSNQTTFNNTLTLANAAYDVALTIRSAQTFGVGGRVAGGVINTGYGVHFQAGSPNTFTLFADTDPPRSATGSSCHPNPPSALGNASSPSAQPGDCIYSLGSDLRVNDYLLNKISISDFCVYGSSGNACAAGGGLSTLDIVFARPNQDAFIVGGVGASHNLYSSACLTLASPQGTYRYIAVAGTGQINANAAPCP